MYNYKKLWIINFIYIIVLELVFKLFLMSPNIYNIFYTILFTLPLSLILAFVMSISKRRKVNKAISIFIWFLLFLIFSAETVYFSFYKTICGFSALYYGGQVMDFFSSILLHIWKNSFIILLYLISFIVLMTLERKDLIKHDRLNIKYSSLLIFSFLSLCITSLSLKINTLDANGQLIKVHGGAILKNTSYSTEDDEVMQRKERNKGAKEKIAKYAAGLIEPGDFVYIDAGTTTDLMIDFITVRQAVFVTNAITHAKKLAQKGCTVYILGGEFKTVTEAIVGEEAVSSVEKYNFTKGFWGANGISMQRGFSTPELKEALVKKRSMENCRDCYILADDSKFNQISSVTFAPFESAKIITTGLTKPAYRKSKNVIEI